MVDPEVRRLEEELISSFFVPKKSVERLLFFSKKYTNKPFFCDRERLKICPDLVEVCRILFTDHGFVQLEERLLKVAAKLRKFPDRKAKLYLPPYSYLRTLDKLHCFYDFHKDISPESKDRRVELFLKLKREIIQTVYFLRKKIIS